MYRKRGDLPSVCASICSELLPGVFWRLANDSAVFSFFSDLLGLIFWVGRVFHGFRDLERWKRYTCALFGYVEFGVFVLLSLSFSSFSFWLLFASVSLNTSCFLFVLVHGLRLGGHSMLGRTAACCERKEKKKSMDWMWSFAGSVTCWFYSLGFRVDSIGCSYLFWGLPASVDAVYDLITFCVLSLSCLFCLYG